MATFVPEGISWIAKAKSLDGHTGAHASLVAFAMAHGLDVEADDAHKELTFIARPGVEPFARRVIGEIRGGDNAVMTITAKID